MDHQLEDCPSIEFRSEQDEAYFWVTSRINKPLFPCRCDIRNRPDFGQYYRGTIGYPWTPQFSKAQMRIAATFEYGLVSHMDVDKLPKDPAWNNPGFIPLESLAYPELFSTLRQSQRRKPWTPYQHQALQSNYTDHRAAQSQSIDAPAPASALWISDALLGIVVNFNVGLAEVNRMHFGSNQMFKVVFTSYTQFIDRFRITFEEYEKARQEYDSCLEDIEEEADEMIERGAETHELQRLGHERLRVISDFNLQIIEMQRRCRQEGEDMSFKLKDQLVGFLDPNTAFVREHRREQTKREEEALSFLQGLKRAHADDDRWEDTKRVKKEHFLPRSSGSGTSVDYQIVAVKREPGLEETATTISQAQAVRDQNVAVKREPGVENNLVPFGPFPAVKTELEEGELEEGEVEDWSMA